MNTAPCQDIFALKNVSFRVARGETLGIVGGNGAGKSTLLKIIAGIATPTSGKVEVQARAWRPSSRSAWDFIPSPLAGKIFFCKAPFWA